NPTLLALLPDPELPSRAPRPSPAAMRIRRSASRLLGSAASASCTEPPRFEPPPPPAPAPAHESGAGFLGPKTSSGGEPCCELSRSPWDLMAQLDLSDPQTCFISVSWRGSWLFPASITMPASSIKEEEDLAVDMVDGVILKLHKAAEKMESMKNQSRQKTYKGLNVKKGVWTCRKNDGKRWCCRRPVSQPNSYCSYQSDQKPPVSDKPRRKRPDIDLGEGFYYYAGFGPGTKRRRTLSSDNVLEPPLPAEPLKEETPDKMQLDFSAGQVQAANESDHQVVLPRSANIVDEPGTAGMPACDKESSDDVVPEFSVVAKPPKEEPQPEMELNFSAGQAQADNTDHQEAAASARVVDKPTGNDGTTGIAGWDEERSDDEALGCNDEQPHDTKRKGPFKKRWRKPVKARSLKSLMMS
uniref:WRC domain-containing protein n=1 Tax=Aegilops tauschii subsp. strangulata TaxID=200361 RepID=A0A453MCM1_AEGTS